MGGVMMTANAAPMLQPLLCCPKLKTMIEQYVAAWNENNLHSYQREFGKYWADGALYVDSFGEYRGVDELTSFAQASLGIIPGRRFSIPEEPEHHHHYGRYSWAVEFSGQTNTGYDYFEFDDSFKITRLISFLNYQKTSNRLEVISVTKGNKNLYQFNMM